MKTNIYTIYDTKAKVYNRPFHLLNDDIALRTATDLASDSNTDLGKHPQDFIMFKLGEYDDNTATFDLFDSPVSMFKFHELINFNIT